MNILAGRLENTIVLISALVLTGMSTWVCALQFETNGYVAIPVAAQYAGLRNDVAWRPFGIRPNLSAAVQGPNGTVIVDRLSPVSPFDFSTRGAAVEFAQRAVQEGRIWAPAGDLDRAVFFRGVMPNVAALCLTMWAALVGLVLLETRARKLLSHLLSRDLKTGASRISVAIAGVGGVFVSAMIAFVFDAPYAGESGTAWMMAISCATGVSAGFSRFVWLKTLSSRAQLSL